MQHSGAKRSSELLHFFRPKDRGTDDVVTLQRVRGTLGDAASALHSMPSLHNVRARCFNA